MNERRPGASRRLAIGLLAGALGFGSIALAPSASATTTVTTERLAGPNRYSTAGAIGVSGTVATPTGAIVSTGQNFPDALAASSLAGANGPQPIILTESAAYTAEARNALTILKAKFPALPVTIVGGTTAVSADVEAAIKADGYTVTRVGGADRYDTANLIARAANARQAGGSIGGVKTAIFATGENFPDALSAGSIAFRNDLPILLVTADSIPAATQSAITVLGIKNAIVVGGTSAVSAAVAAQIGTATGDVTVDRLAAGNRNGTAAAVADYAITTLGFPATSAVLATGTNFPDALAAGPLAGILGAPLLLVTPTSLPGETRSALDKNSNRIAKLFVSGGTSAVDDATLADAKGAAQNTTND